MMSEVLPYCGLPPVPGELLNRFNIDPTLILVLTLLAAAQICFVSRPHHRCFGAGGWLIATAALVSPLCALSVSLFSARVAQHMILILLAAPLIAGGWPRAARHAGTKGLWGSAAAFFVALWFWHMPVPYDTTFSSTTVYWSMHLSLFGSAVLLWRQLLHHAPEKTVEVLAAGALTSMQMGLLGAVLTFAGHPLFLWHMTTTEAWGLTPLHDQQLGGVFMWVPGIALFLWAAVRSLSRLWSALERARPA